MAQPYVGEIRMFAGNFAPNGWMFCEGQLLPISENETLFQLIGTTYGGDGESTFALPNLQSRIPLHMGTGPDGSNFQLAQAAGTEQETLTVQQIPIHNHVAICNVNPALGSPNPANNVPCANDTAMFDNSGAAPNQVMHPGVLSAAGGSQPHENTQPFLCVNFIISRFGIFPSQT